MSIFKPSSPSPMGPSPRALALIDYEDHDRGGHYGPYLIWFVREFSSRFEKLLVFTPNSERSKGFVSSGLPEIPGNVSFHPLPPGPRKLFFRAKRHPCRLSAIAQAAAGLAPGHRIHGFVMWGFDLLRNRAIAWERSGMPWATLGNLSHVKRDSGGPWIKKESGLERLCENHPDCVSLMIWDHFVISANARKLQWLSGYEDCHVNPTSPLAATIRQHTAGKFSIGCFGTLSGPRCLNEILPLTQKHPEIRFVFVGTLDRKRVNKELLPILDEKKPENILLVTGFQQEGDLNAGIEAVDAIFLDGRHYPLHSGIVTKALLLGKCAITPDANSWTRDMINRHQVGFTYASHAQDLIHAWEIWQRSGGSERSRTIMQEQISPARIAKCFDLVTKRLSSASQAGA